MKTTEHLSYRIGVISLFPQMFDALNYGVTGRAIDNKLLTLLQWNLRDYATDKHKTVDDRPFGGGPGMVLKTKPLRGAIHDAKAKLGDNTLCIYLSPQGKVIDQQKIKKLVDSPRPLLLLAGRYEGIDERILDADIDEEWSIGDVVLSGGELAAMVFVDAFARLVPGALGCNESAEQDSFMDGLLDCPHYTRPAVTEQGECVPEVLMSGDHSAINTWRFKQALGRTYVKRPDMIKARGLSDYEKELLNEYLLEHNWE